MKCRKCQTENSKQVKYCVKCGELLREDIKINEVINHKYKKSESKISLKNNELKITQVGILIFLTIITLGIYKIIWCNKVMSYIKNMEGNSSKNTRSILYLLFIPFYNIYWFNKYSRKIYYKFLKEKIVTEDFVSVVTIFECFIPFISLAIFSNKINEFLLHQSLKDN